MNNEYISTYVGIGINAPPRHTLHPYTPTRASTRIAATTSGGAKQPSICHEARGDDEREAASKMVPEKRHAFSPGSRAEFGRCSGGPRDIGLDEWRSGESGVEFGFPVLVFVVEVWVVACVLDEREVVFGLVVGVMGVVLRGGRG